MTLAVALQITLTTLGAALAVFCFVLARRLHRLNDLETGLGGAIAVMTAEIGRLEAAIGAAKAEATAATRGLADEIERAKGERAYWAMQQQFAAAPPRHRLRRRRSTGAADA